MKLITYLKKFFDVEVCEVEEDGTVIPDAIWIYERGEDSEPALILKPTQHDTHWKIGNVYSALPNDAIMSEADIKAVVKAGTLLKQ